MGMTTNGDGLREIRTLDDFDAVRRTGAGFVVVTDRAAGHRVHRADCHDVGRTNFETKVVLNQGRNGRYFAADAYGAAVLVSAKPCSHCKPDRPAAPPV